MSEFKSYLEQAINNTAFDTSGEIPGISNTNIPVEPTPSLYDIKNSYLLNAKAEKEMRLRKDTTDYGNDNFLTRGVKEALNSVLPHDYQLPVNVDGKRYNTANKEFNNDDMTGIWDQYQDNPAGNKVLYYLRKQDPYTGNYVYKPGIAHTSAADRYLTQEKAQGWELLGEKRFDEASMVEKQIHGNSDFLKSRVFDYGSTTDSGGQADNFFGSGKSELYNKDILGLDTGTAEDYQANKDKSYQKFLGNIKSERQAENTFEFIDAFQAGGIRLTGEAIALVGEAVSGAKGDGAIEAIGKRLQKDANKIAGYNPRATAEALKGLSDSYKRGDAIGYIKNMIKGGPQWLANSLPNMGAFAATSMVGTAATGNPIAGLMTGASVMGALRANQILDDREQITKRKATDGEIASIYATSSALAMLEYGALKYAFTGKSILAKNIGSSAAAEDVTSTLVGTPRRLLDTVGWLSNRGKGALAEGSEEVVSGLTEFIMTNYGARTYKGATIAEMLQSPEAFNTVITSFGAGAGAGGIASTIGSVGSITKPSSTKPKIDTTAATEQPSTDMNEYVSGLEKDIADIQTEEAKYADSHDTNEESKTKLEELVATKQELQTKLDKATAYIKSVEDVKLAEKELLDINKDIADIEKTIPDLGEAEAILANEQLVAAKAQRKEIESRIKIVASPTSTKPTGIKKDVQTQIDTNYAEVNDTVITEKQKKRAEEYGKDEAIANDVIKTISELNVKTTDTITASIIDSVSKSYANAKENIDKESDPIKKKSRLEQLEAIKKTTAKTITERVLGMGMSNDMATSLTEADVYVEPINVEVDIVNKPLKKNTRTSLLPDSELSKATKGDMDPTTIIQAITKAFGTASKTITDNIDSIFNGNSGHKAKQRELIRLVDNIQSNKDKIKTTLGSMLNIGNVDNESSNGKAIKAITLGLKNIYNALESEANVAKKAGLSRKGNKDYKSNEVSIASVAPQIGKDFLNSYGLKLKGPSANIAEQYTKIGQEILNALKELGYIDSFNKNGIAPIPSSFVNINNEYIKPTGIPNTEIVTSSIGAKVGYRTTTINLAKVEGSMLKDVVGALSKAMLPANFEMVKDTPVEEIPTHGDRQLSPKEEAIIKKFNKLKNSIKPEFLIFLKELKVSDNRKEFLDALLGTKYNVLDYFKDSTKGFNRSRKDKLDNLLSVLEDIDNNDFYFSHESAINHRIHIMETILDYQGDKFLARNILTGGIYTTNNQIETDVIVNELADEIKVDPKVITGEKTTELSPTEKILVAHVKSYNTNKKLGNGFAYIAISHMYKSIPDKFKPQAFRWLDLVKAVSDVQRTYKNGKVTTDFMPSFDATASGIVNTLMNLSGFKNIQNLIKKLKLKGSTESIDPYMMVTSTNNLIIESQDNGIFPNELKGLMTQTRFNEIKSDKLKSLGELVKAINPNDAKGALRNIVKYAIMPWFYGQHIDNTAKTMAESLAEELITKGLNGNAAANAYILNATKTATAPGHTAATLNDRLIAQLVDSLIDMTTEYVQLLPITFPAVAAYKKFTKSIYELLTAKGSNWNATIATPFQVMTNNADNPIYNMSVKKDKQTLLGLTEDGIPLIGVQAMPNEISLSVNLQHAIDSYLELIGLDAAMSFNSNGEGLQAIHDNIQGPPEKLLASKVVYEQGTVDVAKDYDFINLMINAVISAYSGNLKGQNKVKLDEAVSKFMEANGISSIEEYNKSKSDFLSGIQTDLFGQSIDPKELAKYQTTSKPIKQNTTKPVTRKKQPSNKASKKPTPAEATSIIVDELKDAIREADSTGTNDKLITLLEAISVNDSLSENHKAIVKSIVNRLGKVSVAISQNHSKGSQGKVKIDIDGAPEGIQKLEAHTAETLIETLGHEVEHATTLSALEAEAAKNKKDREPTYNYIVDKLLPRLSSRITRIKNNNVKARVQKIINQSSEINKVAEFLAVMRNEPEMASNIIDVIATNSKKDKETILNRVISYAKELLSSAINFNSNSFRVGNILYSIEVFSNKLAMFEAANESSRTLGMSATGRNKLFSMINSFTEFQNGLVRNLLGAGVVTVKGLVIPMAKYLHGQALSHSTMYTGVFFSTTEGMKNSPFINEMKMWMRHTTNFDAGAYNKLKQIGYTIKTEANTLLTSVMPTLSAKLEKALSKYEMKTINTLLGQLDMHGLSESSHLKDILDGKPIKEAIKEVEKQLNEKYKNEPNKEALIKADIETAKSVANYYVNQVVGEATNLDTGYGVHLKELANLYALDMVPNGVDTLIKFKKDSPYLYNTIMNYSISIGAQKLAINMKETKSYTIYTDFDGNSGMDIYDIQYDFKDVTAEELRTSKYSSEEGWITVREAKDGNIGIIARERIDGQYTPGIGLNSNRFFNGIILSKEASARHISRAKKDKAYLRRNNMVQMQDGKIRVILTKVEKEGKLKVKHNAAQSIIRAYAHNQEVLSMNALRKLVLTYKDPNNKNKSVLADMSADELDALDKGIKEKHLKQDMPMFIKYSFNTYKTYDELPTYIKKFYKTPENISSYNNFNQEISLIRRDMASTLLGYKNIRLFNSEAPMTLQKMEDGYKKLILMMKLKLAIISPRKLGLDAVSDFMYLTGRGVGVDDIYKFGKIGTDAYIELTKLQTMLVKAKLNNTLKSTAERRSRIKNIEKRIANNKFKTANDYGYVQSYSTELMVKDFDTVSGLQKDIDDIVNKITKEKNGDLNAIGLALDKWMKFGAEKGLSVDGLLRAAVSLSRSNNTTIGSELLKLSSRLKSVRDSSDVAQYITNIIGGPGSESVKFGSAFMVGIDAISKYILANVLLERINPETGKLYTEEEAYLEGSAAFLDQRDNMPQVIKLISDLTLSFPSFWARINMVIWNMFKTNPVSATSMAISGEISGINGSTIIGSNIINKAMNGTILNFTNPVQVGTLFPIGL